RSSITWIRQDRRSRSIFERKAASGGSPLTTGRISSQTVLVQAGAAWRASNIGSSKAHHGPVRLLRTDRTPLAYIGVAIARASPQKFPRDCAPRQRRD